MAKTAQPKAVELDIIDLKKGEGTFWLIGEGPMFCNRMAAKAKRELLLPRGPMTKTQRATKLKHAPFAEYRDSPYVHRQVGETMIQIIGSAPKKAVAGAALRMPTTVSKAEINSMVSVQAEYCPIWGIPRLDMSVVRMAGISRTPDIRTRARIDRWATRVTFHWVEPMLNARKVAQLVAGGGIVCGLGDWRIEKGGSNGGYRIVADDDPQLRELVESGGFLAQQEALATPVCANAETEELLVWYLDELGRRGVKVEDEEVEDVEVDDPMDPKLAIFGAGEEVLQAPRDNVGRLGFQDGEEHA